MLRFASRLITGDEFARRPRPTDGSREELVHGEVVTMPPASFRHGEVATQIAVILKNFLKGKELGRAICETGVRTGRRPDSVRGPDVAYWSYARLPKNRKILTYPKEPAELCVEVRSPSNTVRKLRAKVAEYLRTWVTMVWIVDPRSQSLTIYRRTGQPQILSVNDELKADDVIPGFRCTVADLFEID